MASRKRSAARSVQMPAKKKKRDTDVYENKELEDAIKREKIGKLNAMNSPLLRLPGELRNKIYGYVLGDLRPDFIHGYDGIANCNRFDIWIYEKRRNKLGLLHTCRQIYTETALLPYTLNTFVFQTRNMQYKTALIDFLKKLSDAQIKAMKRVRIELQSGNKVYDRSGMQTVKYLGMGR